MCVMKFHCHTKCGHMERDITRCMTAIERDDHPEYRWPSAKEYEGCVKIIFPPVLYENICYYCVNKIQRPVS